MSAFDNRVGEMRGTNHDVGYLGAVDTSLVENLLQRLKHARGHVFSRRCLDTSQDFAATNDHGIGIGSSDVYSQAIHRVLLFQHSSAVKRPRRQGIAAAVLA